MTNDKVSSKFIVYYHQLNVNSKFIVYYHQLKVNSKFIVYYLSIISSMSIQNL
jgi:hypothetical protein